MRRAALALPSLLSLLLLFTLSNCALAAAAEDDIYGGDEEDNYEETARVARVSLVRGDVSVRRAGGDERWERVALNLPLVEGDRLATGADSHLEIQIDARNFLRVGPYATLDIVTLRQEGVALSLPEGTATLRLARFDAAREYFEIDAPGTTVAAERAGLYRIDATQRGRVRISVRDDGRARIYSESSGFALRSGRAAELVRLDNSDDADWNFSDAAAADAWDEWVEERERHLASRLRYDNRERYYDNSVWGAEELDAYGDWVEHRDYGRVWRPSVTVVNHYHDWAPYRHGHWRWLPAYGWTWVGDEPWGWAPYHYGRWVYVDNSWCWAPRGYAGYRNRSWWRPALVAFVFVPGVRGEHVAWYPLHYRHRDPHSNFWRRAAGTDKLRRLRQDELTQLGRLHPIYRRAVSSLPGREFGAAGRGRPADQETARKALYSEPVRGKLPLRPVDAPGGPDANALRGKTGGGRTPGARRNETFAVAPPGNSGANIPGAGANPDGPDRGWVERPTGAARRQPGLALDGELRRGRIFNNREPLGGKLIKPGDAGVGGDSNSGGWRGGVGGGGRGTGVVARPTRPGRNPPESSAGGAGEGGATDKARRERVRPVRPVPDDADGDAVSKRPNWKSGPIERPGVTDPGGDNDGWRGGYRRERTARPNVDGGKPEKPAYRPDPQPEERPEPRYERPERRERLERRERPEPRPEQPREQLPEREERPAREERPEPRREEERPAPPPQREERQPQPPREERKQQSEEKHSAPREKGNAPTRGKNKDY